MHQVDIMGELLKTLLVVAIVCGVLLWAIGRWSRGQW